MITIKPFKGVRPSPELASEVVSLPYDVMSTDEAKQMVNNHPYSLLHITRPEVDCDPSMGHYAETVYRKAKENLHYFLQSDVLIQEEKPCFYVYKLKMQDHVQIGLVTTVACEDYEEKRVKVHEFTQQIKEDDRTHHIDTTNFQAGAAFLIVRSQEKFESILQAYSKKEPLYHFAKENQIEHTLYKIDDDETITTLQKIFAEINTLYIADGHHRSAASNRVRKKREADNPNHTGEEEYNYYLTVVFPDDHLKILDYNRIVKDLNGLDKETFLSKIEEDFELEKYVPENDKEKACKPEASHIFGMYLENEWYKLTTRQHCIKGNDPVEQLDVWILQEHILEPILGIKDLRTDERIQYVGGIRGLSHLEHLVDGGKYKVAFSMYPTQIEELLNVADSNQVMPPKSTWFEPKLGSGIVMHKIGD